MSKYKLKALCIAEPDVLFFVQVISILGTLVTFLDWSEIFPLYKTATLLGQLFWQKKDVTSGQHILIG